MRRTPTPLRRRLRPALSRRATPMTGRAGTRRSARRSTTASSCPVPTAWPAADRPVRRDRTGRVPDVPDGRRALAGLAKNAGEALAAAGLIVPVTLLLLGGQVLPRRAGGRAGPFPIRWPGWCSLAAGGRGGVYPRRAAAVRSASQGWGPSYTRWASSCWLRSSGTHWCADCGRPSTWKGRPYRPAPTAGAIREEQPVP